MAKIRKTPTELKQDALLRSYKKARSKKTVGNKKSFKPKPHESEKTLRLLSYPEFLKSKYWALVRVKVLKRDKNQCVICKSENNLQIHHDTYKNHFKELNHLEDLITLCRDCHKEHHYAQE